MNNCVNFISGDGGKDSIDKFFSPNPVSGFRMCEKFDDEAIYFLIENDEIVYVGKTIQGINRIYQHKGSKKFDGVSCLNVPKMHQDQVEQYFINEYSPRDNLVYPKKYDELTCRLLAQYYLNNQHCLN